MDDALKGARHLPLYETLKKWYAGDPEISTIAAYTGMELISTDHGRAVISFRSGKRFANAVGNLQGGLLTTIADAAMGLAFLCTLAPDEGFTTLELKTNFLRPVSEHTLVQFDATVVHRGRTTGLVNCDVTREEGKLVARCSSTCMVVRPAPRDQQARETG